MKAPKTFKGPYNPNKTPDERIQTYLNRMTSYSIGLRRLIEDDCSASDRAELDRIDASLRKLWHSLVKSRMRS